MKTLLIVSVMLVSSVALAKRDDHPLLGYQCMASGVKAGQSAKVQGWQRRTLPLAKASALQMCADKGLNGCTVVGCYERRL